MSVVDKKIVNFVQGQLPGFVSSDAPKLKEFLEKYYEYLESYKVETDTVIPYFSKKVVKFDIVLDDATKKFQGGDTGSFTDAEIVTGETSTATGVLVKKESLKYYLVETSGTFVDGETITGGTSGHTGTISSVESYNVKIKGDTTTTDGSILADYNNASGNRSFFVEEVTSDTLKQAPRGYKVGESLTFSAEPYLAYTPKVSAYIPQPISAIKNLENLSDIDKTLDDFIDYYMIYLLEAFPRGMDDMTKRLMVKRAKEFYQTKGTEDSFRYVFRTVFSNEELEFYYPRDDILRTSDGKWVISKKMYIKPIGLEVPDIETKILYGATSGASAGIERLVKVRMGDIDVFEVTLNNNSVTGEFTRNESLYYLDGTTRVTVGDAYGLLKSADIINNEQGFLKETTYYIDKNGDVVNLVDVPVADKPFLAKLHICDNDTTNGSISDITIDSAGSGYSQYDVITFDNTDCSDPLIHFRSAKAQVIEVDGGGAITKIRILYPGKGYIKLPTLTVSGGSGASLTAIGTNIGKINKIIIQNPGLKFDIQDKQVDLNTSGTDNLSLKFGTIYTDSGKFDGNSGFLSDKKFLIDSLYYQEYSYVLKIGLETRTYKDIVKRLVHPAGFQMFGEISTKTNLAVKLKQNIRDTILKITQKLDMKNKHEYERWLKILSEVAVKMKLDEIHGGFLPKLVFPTSVEASLRLIDAQLQSIDEVRNILITLVDEVDNYDDVKIDEWLWLDHETWKIKYHNLVVDPTEEHMKQTKLAGTVSGIQGDMFLTGTGTSFLSDFSEGDYIIVGDKKFIVDFDPDNNPSTDDVDDDTIFITTPLCEDITSEVYLKEENLL